MRHSRDDVGGNVVENVLERFGSMGRTVGEAGSEVSGLHLREDREGLDLGVVVGYEVDHLVGLFSEFFGV